MAHVRYNKILTHSHTTPGLSCHFSIFFFFFFFFWGGASVSSGNCETMESWKISNFDSTREPRNHVNFAIHCWWRVLLISILLTVLSVLRRRKLIIKLYFCLPNWNNRAKKRKANNVLRFTLHDPIDICSRRSFYWLAWSSWWRPFQSEKVFVKIQNGCRQEY